MTTAEDESIKEYSLSIYPNPAHSEMTLIPEGNEVPEEISILNTTGDVVLVAKDKPARIDISELPSGVYVLRYKHSTGQLDHFDL